MRFPRRWLTAFTGAAVAATMAWVVSGRACVDEQAQPPAEVATRFAAAARAGDVRSLYALLGPRTRAALDAAAVRATEAVGGGRRYGAVEMLGASVPVDGWDPVDVVVTDGGTGAAQARLRGPGGQSAVLDLVRVDGTWRVELPVGDATRGPDQN